MNNITDIIIHIDENLNDQKITEVSNQLSHNKGVVSVGRNPRTPKFLMVVYNTGRTQSKKILNAVTDLGYRASLVGM
ncbi:MAG: hypothetical protein OEW99_10455 [Gammaproteobacteria bacterium]|nr:hypothetical protein [Gammaproteobacteria bacterium]